jgi:hypothetical protein
LPSLDQELNEVLNNIEQGNLKNNHFYTQTWYLGDPKQYDMVVHIDELHQLMIFLNEAAELGLSEKEINIHDNKTMLKMYGDALTTIQRQRIKKFYRKDYENGWCKIEDKI